MADFIALLYDAHLILTCLHFTDGDIRTITRHADNEKHLYNDDEEEDIEVHCFNGSAWFYR